MHCRSPSRVLGDRSASGAPGSRLEAGFTRYGGVGEVGLGNRKQLLEGAVLSSPVKGMVE